jgi:hypothetical protein
MGGDGDLEAKDLVSSQPLMASFFPDMSGSQEKSQQFSLHFPETIMLLCTVQGCQLHPEFLYCFRESSP